MAFDGLDSQRVVVTSMVYHAGVAYRTEKKKMIRDQNMEEGI